MGQFEKLGIALISPNVADRLEKAKKTNYNGMKRHLQLLITAYVVSSKLFKNLAIITLIIILLFLRH